MWLKDRLLMRFRASTKVAKVSLFSQNSLAELVTSLAVVRKDLQPFYLVSTVSLSDNQLFAIC